MSWEEDSTKSDDELKIELESTLRSALASAYWKDSASGAASNAQHHAIVTGDLLALLLETYKEAIAMGWETKVLDCISDKIREAAKR